MGKSNIPWCDYVWNPIAGCTKVSAGCKKCWAERMAFRLKRRGVAEYQDVVDDAGGWTGQVNCLERRLEQPLHWRKPRRIFVCSMSDLFHPKVSFDFIARVFDVMASPRTEQHTFVLLTKRADRMRHFYNWLQARFETGGFWSADSALGLALEERWPLPNVWVMVTVENKENLWRIGELMDVPAIVRGVCLEPMLEPIDVTRACLRDGDYLRKATLYHLGSDVGIDWIVVGAESGPNRRSFKEEWAWDVRDQCLEAGVPCFLKQGSGPRPGVPLLDREGRTVKEFPKEVMSML